MLPYVIVAVLLSLALVLFSMAMNHKTLLAPEVKAEMLSRIARLTPETKARWGRMSVNQMLRHLAEALRMATGDLATAPRRGPLRLFPIKQLIVFVLPFPKNAPTAPELRSRNEVDFASERARVRDLVATFAKKQIDRWPEHPAFGPLSREQWGVMVWKHLDHHLRQFGV